MYKRKYHLSFLKLNEFAFLIQTKNGKEKVDGRRYKESYSKSFNTQDIGLHDMKVHG